MEALRDKVLALPVADKLLLASEMVRDGTVKLSLIRVVTEMALLEMDEGANPANIRLEASGGER